HPGTIRSRNGGVDEIGEVIREADHAPAFGLPEATHWLPTSCYFVEIESGDVTLPSRGRERPLVVRQRELDRHVELQSVGAESVRHLSRRHVHGARAHFRNVARLEWSERETGGSVESPCRNLELRPAELHR